MKKSATKTAILKAVTALFAVIMLVPLLVACGAGSNTTETEQFTVTFIDVTGEIIKTDYVEKGSSATLPVMEVPEGIYQTWEGTYEKVKKNEEVHEVRQQMVDVAITYTKLNNGTFALAEKNTKFGALLTTITFPSVYNDKDVTAIADSGFASCRKLTKAVLPEKLLTIGESAFAFCCRLEEINLPETVTTIGDYAFRGCEAVKTVSIPASVTKLGVGSFRNCLALESVSFAGALEEISEAAFSGCSALTSIVLPADLKKIGMYAFYQTGLKEIILPVGVEEIGNWAFSSSDKLEKVTLPETVKTIGSWAFQNCDALKTIEFVGTKAQWAEVTKKVDWNVGLKNLTIQCSDGVYTEDAE